MTRPTRVEIVLPIHNRRDTTLQALTSLSRINTDGLDVHMIVVDDGSTDGSSQAILNAFPQVQIIIGDGHLHYAAGTNRGIEAAMARDADFIVAANDDTIFHKDFLIRMLKTARDNPRSVVGALLLLWDEPHLTFQIDFKWRTTAGGWLQIDRRSVFDLPRRPFEVEGLAGNCVLIPAETIRECGLMDEKRFPHGWGDIQYFVRMKKKGWKLLVDPSALVWCEPNTNPPPLHSLPIKDILRILFIDRRHPLNLQRQFIARWESAPTRGQAAGAFVLYLFKLAGKSVRSRSQKAV